MSVTADGKIKEVYQTGENNYDTDDKTCSCSAFAQLFFCRHLIYYRISNKLVLFNKEAFHPSLLQGSDCNQTPHKQARETIPDSPGMAMEMEEARNQKRPLTQAKKYNAAFDVGKEMAEILAVYHQEAFETHLNAAKDFVRLLRNGLNQDVISVLNNPDNFDLLQKASKNRFNITENSNYVPSFRQASSGHGNGQGLSQPSSIKIPDARVEQSRYDEQGDYHEQYGACGEVFEDKFYALPFSSDYYQGR